jgi:ribose transport system substrate-binding protein
LIRKIARGRVSFEIEFSLPVGLYILSPGDGDPPLNYHFSLYLPDNRNFFFTGIVQGAEQAASTLQIGGQGAYHLI